MRTPLPAKQRHVNHKPAASPPTSRSSNNPSNLDDATTGTDRHQAILAALGTGIGNGLNVSATYLRATFGGASAYYSLWLGQPCTSTVVVHLMFTLDSFRSMKVSSDRICFTPENYNVPQLVRIDVMDHRSHSSVISHRIFSLDKSYDRISTPSVVVKTDWCGVGSLLAFGGPMSKRKAATVGSKITRIDLHKAIPTLPNCSAPGTSFRVVDSGDPSWFVSHLASGHNFSLAVVLHQNTMTCFSWGLDAHGELGLGSTTSVPDPRLITSLPMQVHGEQLGVLAVSCGKHRVALVTTQAKLFTWGNNKYGQLGHGDYANRLVPQEVHFAFALATLAPHQRALRIKPHDPRA
ncbi:Rcc1 and btb domain-containing protein 2, partial [Globisporangium splendens]